MRRRRYLAPAMAWARATNLADASYDSFVYSEPVGATPPVTGCAYAVNASSSALYDIDCSGQRVFAFQYLDYQIVDDTWATNAQLVFGDVDERWPVAAFVRNVEDDRFAVNAQIYNSVQAGLATPAVPRTHDVRGTMKF